MQHIRKIEYPRTILKHINIILPRKVRPPHLSRDTITFLLAVQLSLIMSLRILQLKLLKSLQQCTLICKTPMPVSRHNGAIRDTPLPQQPQL